MLEEYVRILDLSDLDPNALAEAVFFEVQDEGEPSGDQSRKVNAKGIPYDNSGSGLTATKLPDAVDELDADVDALEGRADSLEIAETAMKGVGWTDENLTDHEGRIVVNENHRTGNGSDHADVASNSGRLDTLEADDETEGSVDRKIKEQAENADYTGEAEGSTVKEAIDGVVTRLSGTDTLVYEGTTYRVSKSIVDGHLVEHYEEVV